MSLTRHAAIVGYLFLSSICAMRADTQLTLNPGTAAAGTILEIRGTTFDADLKKNDVIFTGVDKPVTPESLKDGSMLVRVPPAAQTGKVRVEVKNTDGTSTELGTAQFTITKAEAVSGTTCKPLEFGFKVSGSNTVSLLVTSDTDGEYEITVRTLPPPKAGKVRSCGDDKRTLLTVTKTLTSGTKEIPFPALDKCDLNTIIDADGWVDVSFKGNSKNVCPQKAEGSGPVLMLEKHKLTLDVGTVFSLESGGNWKSNPELALNATSRWLPRLRGSVDIRYSSIGAIQASPTPTPAPSASPSPTPTPTPAPATNQNFNPFTSAGGILRADVSFIYSLSDAPAPPFGVVGGLGLSTIPGKPGDKLVDARPRFFLGGRAEALGYNAGLPGDSLTNTRGYFQVVAAYDNLWKWDEQIAATETTPASIVHHNARWRAVAQGQLELPQIGGEYLRIAVRLIADMPFKSREPSDVRISALATLDPKLFRALFGGVGAVPKASSSP